MFVNMQKLKEENPKLFKARSVLRALLAGRDLAERHGKSHNLVAEFDAKIAEVRSEIESLGK